MKNYIKFWTPARAAMVLKLKDIRIKLHDYLVLHQMECSIPVEHGVDEFKISMFIHKRGEESPFLAIDFTLLDIDLNFTDKVVHEPSVSVSCALLDLNGNELSNYFPRCYDKDLFTANNTEVVHRINKIDAKQFIKFIEQNSACPSNIKP